jgi:hypothetical protein
MLEVKKQKVRTKMLEWQLTADHSAFLKSSGNLRVHRDKQVLLHGKVLVSLLDLLFNKLSQRLADNGVSQINDILPWKTVLILFNRKEVQNLNEQGLDKGVK